VQLYASLRVTSHFTTVAEAYTSSHSQRRGLPWQNGVTFTTSIPRRFITTPRPPVPPRSDIRRVSTTSTTTQLLRPEMLITLRHFRATIDHCRNKRRSPQRSSFYFTINEVIMWIKRLYVCCSELHSTLGDQSNAVHIKLIVV